MSAVCFGFRVGDVHTVTMARYKIFTSPFHEVVLEMYNGGGNPRVGFLTSEFRDCLKSPSISYWLYCVRQSSSLNICGLDSHAVLSTELERPLHPTQRNLNTPKRIY